MPDVSDQSFEDQFSNLAYTFLSDRAPALTDYSLGFQVVDKEDDGTRGMGVFGLRIGKELAYVPAFFINGEIKGVDMIYAVGADVFVPLTDDWVNYFLHRKPYEIGEGTSDSRVQRGVRTNRLREIFNNIPGGRGTGFGKVASELGVNEHLAGVIDRVFEKTASGVWDETFADVPAMFIPGESEVMDLPAALGHLGPKIATDFLEQMKHDPKLAAAVLETYEPAELAEEVINVTNTQGLGEGQEVVDPSGPALKKQKDLIEVITDPEAMGLSDEERETLMAGGKVVRDVRSEDEDQVSKVYNVTTGKELENPTGPGVYDVLMGDGTFATTIIADPKTYGNGRTSGVVLLIQPHRKSVTSYWKSDVLARVKYPDDKFRAAWDEVGKAPTQVKKGEKVIFVNQRGESTFPATVEQKITGENGTITLWVRPDYYVVEKDHTAWAGERYTGPNRVPEDRAIVTDDGKAMDDRWKYQAGMYELERGGEDRGNRIIIDENSGSLAIRQTGSTTVLDRDQFKAVVVDKRLKSRADYGTTADYHLALGKFAKEMQIERYGTEFMIDGPLGRFERLSKEAAWDKLVFDHALRADIADHLLEKTAGIRRFDCRIKLANAVDPSALDDYGHVDAAGQWTLTPAAMTQTDTAVDREDPQSVYGYEPGQEDYRGQASMYSNDVNAVANASAAGSKEVLDTSVLTGLLNVHDVGAKIDKYIPSLMSGLDKMGRLLFMLYWHWDKFEDQYGKRDAIELEDKLKMVFEHTGELVIFLHQNSLMSDPEAVGLGVL